tara:strand:- start:780 stop:1043 length:264 start_codon:yes stop_codon:yes gene_type:complete
MTREGILTAALNCVNGQRDETYGSPEDNFNTVAAMWEAYLGMELRAKDVAAMMALVKIARISTGKSTDDNWVDLAGYAACGGEVDSL